ncbi:DUF917-domain-containing protein [Pluteus cervinus]|uniref:DUF917-domain-containing protein n=1 Tax=Pluteus cervinus TaxID=181527 RepID=A0ACD3AHM8_9AGAR|nr:DUF917-domain-containing protein [Pluteus cervinus]
MYRIGVDVGGTNTDGVILKIGSASTPDVVAFHKTETTQDVTTGIELAVRRVLDQLSQTTPDELQRILSLTIGTTHFVNAVVQLDASKLSKVAVLRLAAPYTEECPPFIDFPEDLKLIISGYTAVLKGGLQIDGRPINEIDEGEILQQAQIILQKGLKDIVLVGVYAPLDLTGRNEYKVREILQRELGPTVNIVCSRDVGHIGLLERENASILNASLLRFARTTIRAYKRAMRRLHLSCPLYLTQNDGTVISAKQAAALPIRTFSSGATNSMRGASYLANLDAKEQRQSTLVMDIGGTTTDIGVLLPSGFPRQASAFVEIAGVRTNFSMPDLHSIGLGGGSKVRAGLDGRVSVGPDSVGHYAKAYVFGGQTLTATDIAVRLGVEEIGDRNKLQDLDEALVIDTQKVIKITLENAIDRMKTSQEDCDLLLVGGGSIVAPTHLKGIRQIIQPNYHTVANAVGAAIAGVSGEVDTVEILQGKSLDEALERIKIIAIERAITAGADKGTVRVVEINVFPIQYVTNQATRIIVRAVGQLASAVTHLKADSDDTEDEHLSDSNEGTHQFVEPISRTPEQVDYIHYRPAIKGHIWNVSEVDLFFIMEGCGVLGTGGGGSPYPIYLICRQILRNGGKLSIVDYESLDENAFVSRGGYMGSPSVTSERIKGGSPLRLVGMELAKYCGVNEYVATLCDEIGGGNGMFSLVTSGAYGIPALDGDLMGRAYPMLNQLLPGSLSYRYRLIPCGLSDGDGNVVVRPSYEEDKYVESIMRVVTTEMGSSAALCPPPLEVREARDYGVTRSLSQAWRIGRAIAISRQTNNMNGLPDALLAIQNGKCLFKGKVVHVARRSANKTQEVRAGFTWGEVHIAPLRQEEMEDLAGISEGQDSDMKLVIPFQNENLYAYIVDGSGKQTIIASVPDLITVLDSQSGSHLGTPEYCYGLRVTVIALAGHPLWRTPIGLQTGGPQAFGLDHNYEPIGEYKVPDSVIREYRS